VPEASAHDVASVEAVALFVERARAAVPGFTLNRANAAAIVEVVRRLDGIPLALELAAARVRALSVQQIAERLDDRFWLLVGGGRTVLPRQRTLSATLEWSYQLLGADEKAILGRLSVFAGGWCLEAAEAVGAREPVAPGDILDLLTSLVDKSLVLADAPDDGGEVRYHLLETIRQYASDRLLEAGETTAARDRHLTWAIRWAESATPHIVGPDQVRWLRRIALEHENFLAALTWCRTQQKGPSELRLAAALGRFWHLHGPSREGREWLRHALDATVGAPPSVARAQALNWAGRLATVNGEADDRPLLEASVAASRAVGDTRTLAVALRHLSLAAQQRGDDATARSAMESALGAARAAGDRREEAFALVSLGAAAEQAGGGAVAQQLLADGLVVAREVGDAGPVGWALSVLGAIAVREGRYDHAGELLSEALALSRPMGYWAVMVASLAQLGALALAQADLVGAREHARACVAAAHEIGDMGLMAAALTFFADLDLQTGLAVRGIRLLGAEEAWRGLTTRRVVSFWSWPTPRIDAAREQLGDAAFERAWRAGQRLSLDAAVQEALDDYDGRLFRRRSLPRSLAESSTAAQPPPRRR
jgi:non-specific serine/threonine protein kinase